MVRFISTGSGVIANSCACSQFAHAIRLSDSPFTSAISRRHSAHVNFCRLWDKRQGPKQREFQWEDFEQDTRISIPAR
jgi:hypothetical protein